MKLCKHRGFTLVETVVSMVAASIFGVGTYYLLNTTMLLWSKNFAFNVTGNSLHRSIDRIEQYLQQADTMPTLIDAQGNAVSSGSAQGVVFDYYVGAPYVITASTSGLAAGITSFQMNIYCADSTASAVFTPLKGDVVRIDGTNTTLRPTASANATVTGSVPGNQQMTVNLTSGLASAVTTTNVTNGVTARVVRPMALVVEQNGGQWELRLVRPYNAPADLNDSTKYVVLSRQIGSVATDQSPFSITQNNGQSFVSCSLCLRADSYDQVLANKQKDSFSTFARADLAVRPRSNP